MIDVYHQTTKLGALAPHEKPDPNESIQTIRDRVVRELHSLARQNLTCKEEQGRGCVECVSFCKYSVPKPLVLCCDECRLPINDPRCCQNDEELWK